jgi:transcriptional regulator GlxA family with amidase domain
MELTAHCVASAHPGREKDAPGIDILDQALALFHAHPEMPLDMGTLAGRFQVSETWLRRAFHRHTGLPPKKFLLELRFARAKHLLADTQDSVNAVAEACGFAHPAFFVRSFKAKTGLTPLGWRKKYRPRPRS